MVFTRLASPPAQAGGYGVPDRTRVPGTVRLDKRSASRWADPSGLGL